MLNGVLDAPAGGCGGATEGCGCGGSCGTKTTAPVTPPVTVEPPAGPCGEDCAGDCGPCQERRWVNALNWGRANAHAASGLSPFWRRALVGEAFHRSTGEVLPEALRETFTSMDPAWSIAGISKPEYDGRSQPTLRMPRFPEAQPWQSAWPAGRVLPWSNPTPEDGSPSPVGWDPPPFFASCATMADDSYPDHTTGDDPECTSVWANTFYLHRNMCAIGRVLVNCQNDKCDGRCEVKGDGSGCKCIGGGGFEPPPPPPPKSSEHYDYSCCCCPKGDIKVRNEVRAKEPKVRQSARGFKMFGHEFTLLITLSHKGVSSGRSAGYCKCQLRWREWTTEPYGQGSQPGGYRVPAGRWFDLSSDDRSSPHWNPLAKDWSQAYGSSGIRPACAERRVEVTDTPSVSVDRRVGFERKLWISVCASACPDADADCPEDDMVRCLRIFQFLSKDREGNWHGSIEFGTQEQGVSEDPPDGWTDPETFLFSAEQKTCRGV